LIGVAGCHAQHRQTAFAKQKWQDAMFCVNTARFGVRGARPCPQGSSKPAAQARVCRWPDGLGRGFLSLARRAWMGGRAAYVPRAGVAEQRRQDAVANVRRRVMGSPDPSARYRQTVLRRASAGRGCCGFGGDAITGGGAFRCSSVIASQPSLLAACTACTSASFSFFAI
jgi:hypothetical protein